MKNVVVVELFGFELVGGGDVVGDAVFDAVFDAVDIAVSDVVGIEVGPLVGDGVGSELTEYLYLVDSSVGDGVGSESETALKPDSSISTDDTSIFDGDGVSWSSIMGRMGI